VLSKLLGQQQQQVTLQLLSNRNGHAAIHSPWCSSSSSIKC
jgi:hypothetical protein